MRSFVLVISGCHNRVSNKELLVARSNKRHKKYIDGCDMYQRMKSRTEAPVGKLKLSKILEKL